MFEEFENSNLGRIAVIKYHTQGPDPSDPYYIAQAPTKESTNRSTYYKITGVPTMMYAGFTGTNPGIGAAAMTTKLNAAIAATPTSPYQISVTQAIEGDSVIANVTVKVVSAPPTATDLRLAVVFTERFNEFTGNNGTPFHTDIARKVVPGLTTAGEIKVDADYPAFSQAEGETKTYRYAALIGETWDVNQLVSVAFIQSAKSKTIYQTEWTLPSITGPAGTATIESGAQDVPVTIQNSGTNPMVVNVDFTSTTTPGFTLALEGVTNNQITIAPNTTASFSLKANSNGTGSARYGIKLVTDAGMYLSEMTGSYFGKDNDVVVVNGTSDADFGYELAGALLGTERKAGVMSRGDWMGKNDWTGMKTVLYTADDNVGIQIGTFEWENALEFVEGGGNFGFSGSQMVSIYAGSGNEGYMDNIRNIFGVDPTAARSTRWTNLLGVEGDVVGDGISTAIAFSIARQNLEIMEGSDAVVMFKNDKGDNVGVRNWVGNGKTALMTFDLDNLNQTDRALIADRLMDWFESANSSVKTSDVATSTKLSNYPNPFNPSTTIEFSITEPSPVTLIVKDMMGREVATLIDFQMHEKGTYSQSFDASELASGTYMYELTAGSTKITEKMILNK
jgi:hypothetical protein